MYLWGFEQLFVNNCNDINKKAKVFQKCADNISVSKRKKQKKKSCIQKGLVKRTGGRKNICPRLLIERYMMDEHEALIEYSEMTTFDFNSKEYQEIRRDYTECRDTVSRFVWLVKNFFSRTNTAENY